MPVVNATIKGIKTYARTLDKEQKRQHRALYTALRVEGYRLTQQLKKEIRAGNPGGNKLKGLSFLARLRKSGRLKPDKPLIGLAAALRYKTKYSPMEVRFGWEGTGASDSWRYIAKQAALGYSIGISHQKRVIFARKGAALGKRSSARKYHFLKKSTTSAKVPQREIMEPFWAANRRDAIANIKKNFRRKLRGERI